MFYTLNQSKWHKCCFLLPVSEGLNMMSWLILITDKLICALTVFLYHYCICLLKKTGKLLEVNITSAASALHYTKNISRVKL